MQALYGRRHAIASVDLPIRLEALTTQLPPEHPCRSHSIIDHHTFLPYHAPFLRTTAYEDARRYMWDGSKSSVRVRVGTCTNRVRPPKFFRNCPMCDQENRGNHDEVYWRRLFQLPGVETCPIHEVFLEQSNIRLDPLPNRHKYFSAQRACLGTGVHRVNPRVPAHRILLGLACRVDWLLRQQRLNPGLDFLHQQYAIALAKKGFATRAGSVRMDDLRRRVLEFYGPMLLDLLQCGLPDDKGDGWLGHLLRKTGTAVAPLRHLLLLLALDVDLERFFYPSRFSQVVQTHLARNGPWSCLNPVCEHRGKLSIDQADLQPADTNGINHTVIRCPHCSFAYQLRAGAETQIRANRVVDYGPIWKTVLRQHWADFNVTLRRMAETLGVDPKTVKQRAAEMKLPFPRKGKRPVTKRGLYVVKQRDKTKRLKSHRHAWIALRGKRPAAGTKELRSHAPALYAWLYRNDRVWLKDHQPKRLEPTVTRVHVDWANRDEKLAGQIATIAAHIKNQPGRLRRVTVTAIGRALGKQSLFAAALAKLPLTRSVINSVVESGEDFAVRRVHAAAQKLRLKEGAFPWWKLIRAAGLHYRLERHPKVRAALTYEMRPFVRGLIVANRESAAPELMRLARLMPMTFVANGLREDGS